MAGGLNLRREAGKAFYIQLADHEIKVTFGGFVSGSANLNIQAPAEATIIREELRSPTFTQGITNRQETIEKLYNAMMKSPDHILLDHNELLTDVYDNFLS